MAAAVDAEGVDSAEGLDVTGLPSMEEMPRVVGGFVNSGISINYVKDWKLKEALRELIQNAVDGMTSFMNTNGGSKKDWKIDIIDKEYHGTKYRDFVFRWPQKNLCIGKVTYYPDIEQLVLENPGSINKFNLLLGGSGGTKQNENPDIIGRFGEGMKLAALALLRPNIENAPPYTEEMLINNNNGRTLTIDTNKERWLFKFQKDLNFNNHICLFYKITQLTDKKINKLGLRDKWTYTRINGLKIQDWNDNYKNFLFFLKSEELLEIKTRNQGKCKHKGSILLDDAFKGKFFVKQLHIKDFGTYSYDCKSQESTFENFKSQSDNAASFYGYDSNEIDLNRDRMSIPNLWHRYDRCSCILADTLNNYKSNISDYSDCIDELTEMWQIVYWLLRFSKYEVWYFANYISKDTANRIWDEWVKDRLYFPNNENGKSEIMPLHGNDGHKVVKFLYDYNLSENFYRYVFVSDRLWYVLKQSKYYENWNNRFNKLIDNCKDAQLNENEIKIQNKIIEQIKKVKNTFKNEDMYFKDKPLTEDTSFCKNGKLYIAKELLNDETKLMAKCLILLNIPTASLLQCFDILK